MPHFQNNDVITRRPDVIRLVIARNLGKILNQDGRQEATAIQLCAKDGRETSLKSIGLLTREICFSIERRIQKYFSVALFCRLPAKELRGKIVALSYDYT